MECRGLNTSAFSRTLWTQKRNLGFYKMCNTLYDFSLRKMYRTVSSMLGASCGRLQGCVILQLVGLQWLSAVFLKLGSAEHRRSEIGIRVTTLPNCGRVILAVLHFYVRITVRVATFVTNHYVTDSTLTVNRCCSPEASWFCSPFGQQLVTDSRCVMWDDAVEASRSFVTCNVHRVQTNAGI